MNYREEMMKRAGIESLNAPITLDDLIESEAIQELRLCCLELGIDPNEFIEEE